MSPDEILAALRDIHLPPSEAGTATAAGFNAWPLLFVAAALALLLAIRAWRRGGDMRRLRRDVESFAASPSDGGMDRLLTLRNRVAATGLRPLPLPPACFAPRGADDQETIRQAADDLSRVLAG